MRSLPSRSTLSEESSAPSCISACRIASPCRPGTLMPHWFNRHLTTCIIILCVLTNNHG